MMGYHRRVVDVLGLDSASVDNGYVPTRLSLVIVQWSRLPIRAIGPYEGRVV